MAFSALGIITSVYAKWVPDAQMYANFLRFPMTFLSGTFVALTTYPLPLQVVARFLPLTYSIEALQNCISSSAVTNIYLIDIAALFVFTVIFLSIATAVLKKGSNKSTNLDSRYVRATMVLGKSGPTHH